MESSPRPRIGVSANRMAPARNRRFYIGKALQYCEEQMLQLVWRFGGLPVMTSMVGDTASRADLVEQLDGLLLSGGDDVSPTIYGQTPLRPEWAGDPNRDRFELELIEAFLEADKPILGICRGVQILNVALGGTLWQDLVEQGAVERQHRDPSVYDELEHGLRIRRPSLLYDLYKVDEAMVNTVHHQAIRDLGRDLEVMAESDDGLIEAVRLRSHQYVVGVQWHPEWITAEQEARGLLAPGILMREFIGRAAPHPDPLPEERE